ncbi:hypothetical protein TNCV_2889471 [Trichonephila clavipes]|nr:hypothetical protein TNCV_2889471 [Trichonephila clavipes]
MVADVARIFSDTLKKVWDELTNRIDVCRVTNGAHIEHLETCRRREREEPGLGWRKGKSPALDGESMRGEPWLERRGRERERKGLSSRLEWKDDERRWR